MTACGSGREGGRPPPPMTASSVWKRLPRLLLSSRASFAGFLRSVLGEVPPCQAPRSDDHSAATNGIWPIPPPFPSAWKPRGARPEGDYLDAGPLHSGLNLAVVILSWLHLGRPSAAPRSCRLGVTLSQQQRETVERLSAPFDVWLAEPPVDLADLGRAREGASQRYAALRRLEARAGDLRAELDPYAPARRRPDPRFDEQRRSRRDPGTILVDLLPGTIESTCQPVVAARLGFSGRPVFNQSTLFDAHTRDVYMNPLAFRSFTADMPLAPPSL